MAEWFVCGVRAEWLEGRLFDNEVDRDSLWLLLCRLLLFCCLCLRPREMLPCLLEMSDCLLIDMGLQHDNKAAHRRLVQSLEFVKARVALEKFAVE